MKRLTIPNNEIVAQMFFPAEIYNKLHDKFKCLTFRGWAEDKLIQAGFDLSKEITTYTDVCTLGQVFIQYEEGDAPYDDFAGDSSESASSEVPTQGGLQTLSWDRIQKVIEEICG